MRSLKFKRFPSAEDGATAVEFALVAPVLFFLAFGIVETGIVYAADILLKNATYDAARTGRTGFVSDGKTQDDTVKQKILSQAGVLMDPDKIVFTSKSYKGFYNLRKPEPFTDKNGNGRRDDGVCIPAPGARRVDERPAVAPSAYMPTSTGIQPAQSPAVVCSAFR